jgi:hypothetical protein
METTANVFLQAPVMSFSPLDLLPKTQQANLETLVPPVTGKLTRK